MWLFLRIYPSLFYSLKEWQVSLYLICKFHEITRIFLLLTKKFWIRNYMAVYSTQKFRKSFGKQITWLSILLKNLERLWNEINWVSLLLKNLRQGFERKYHDFFFNQKFAKDITRLSILLKNLQKIWKRNHLAFSFYSKNRKGFGKEITITRLSILLKNWTGLEKKN